MKTIVNHLLLALVMLPVSSLYCQNTTESIMKAYELRMDGHTKEALEVLTQIIESDSTNAMAHFEISRAIEDQKKSYHIKEAIRYQPDNLMYRFYQANLQMLEAYKAMKTNNTELITYNLDLCTKTLKSILTIKPDCKESLLFLIDIYGSLPKEMGGNIEFAQNYLKILKRVDNFYAAQGELITGLNNDADLVNHWKTYIDTYGESNEALIKLGKAYLMTNAIENAQACFNKVMKRDPKQTILYLDVARAYLYAAMRGGDQQDESLKKFKENIHLYLDTTVEKPKLLEAWCYGWLGMIEGRQGNKELADNYAAKAEKLIPDYPKYTAIPIVDEPPNVMVYHYRSYFTPF